MIIPHSCKTIRAAKPCVWLVAIVMAFLSTQCSDPMRDPVGPGTQGVIRHDFVPFLGGFREGMNFFSVPDPAWEPNGSKPWGGDLVVYAHGYYAPTDPDWSPEKDRVDDTPISEIVNNLGMAFASTGYREKGLVVPEAVEDIVALVDLFVGANGGLQPRHIYLVGPSEGGLVTTLAIEKHAGKFSGGMAMCGPIGNFRSQLDYLGDFHIVFQYFFPGMVPGNPAGVVPPMDPGVWETKKPLIEAAVVGRPAATQQLLKVTSAKIDPLDPSTVPKTVLDILWYDMFATNDAIERLHGRPFNNRNPFRWYSGSMNDLLLNLRIPRFTAEAAALQAVQVGFQTTGRLSRPLVTLHTTGDPIVPYWHASLYSAKALFNGSGLLHTHIPIIRYGHCTFKTYEVLAGFAVLVLKVTGRELLVPTKALPSAEGQIRLLELSRGHGASPRMVQAVAAVQ